MTKKKLKQSSNTLEVMAPPLNGDSNDLKEENKTVALAPNDTSNIMVLNSSLHADDDDNNHLPPITSSPRKRKITNISTIVEQSKVDGEMAAANKTTSRSCQQQSGQITAECGTLDHEELDVSTVD